MGSLAQGQEGRTQPAVDGRASQLLCSPRQARAEDKRGQGVRAHLQWAGLLQHLAHRAFLPLDGEAGGRLFLHGLPTRRHTGRGTAACLPHRTIQTNDNLCCYCAMGHAGVVNWAACLL